MSDPQHKQDWLSLSSEPGRQLINVSLRFIYSLNTNKVNLTFALKSEAFKETLTFLLILSGSWEHVDTHAYTPTLILYKTNKPTCLLHGPIYQKKKMFWQIERKGKGTPPFGIQLEGQRARSLWTPEPWPWPRKIPLTVKTHWILTPAGGWHLHSTFRWETDSMSWANQETQQAGEDRGVVLPHFCRPVTSNTTGVLKNKTAVSAQQYVFFIVNARLSKSKWVCIKRQGMD